MRRRLDAELVRRGLASGRSSARELVESGRVLVSGSVAEKPARLVDPADPVVLRGDPPRYVGRGATKLEAALEHFDLDPSGARVLDAGASTGGFTDCLLQHGASEDVPLDIEHRQLHEKLRGDPRVVVMERTNLRHVDPVDIGPFDAAVADLSFISLTVVMEVLVGALQGGAAPESGWLVVLVKPQFECGRAEVARGRGVVKEPSQWRYALERVSIAAQASSAAIMDVMVSPLRGAEGNTEFLMLLRPQTTGATVPADPEVLIDRVLSGLERTEFEDAESEQ